MNDDGQVIFLNHLVQGVHVRIVELNIEMAGKERYGPQSQFVNATLELTLCRFRLMDRQMNTTTETRRVLSFNLGDAVVQKPGDLGSQDLDLIRENRYGNPGLVHDVQMRFEVLARWVKR